MVLAMGTLGGGGACSAALTARARAQKRLSWVPRARQSIDLRGFSPGDYRAHKTVTVEVTDVSTTHVVEFKIVK